MTNLTLLDLFSGIGGFSLAAEWTGRITTIGFSEIDPYATRLLKHHWPNVPNFGDIRNITTKTVADAHRQRQLQSQGLLKDERRRTGNSDLEAASGEAHIDIIAGGPPCQPASCAGQRRGAADDRWLWPQTLAVVDTFRPTFCLFENPCGLLTLNNGLEFERVLSGLESLGYSVQPFVVPAVAVDARHRRDRVWIVAHASSLRRERLHQGAGGFGQGPGWTPDSGTKRGAIEESSREGEALANPRRMRDGAIQHEPVTERHAETDACKSGETLAHPNQTGRREQCRPEPVPTQHPPTECGREALPNPRLRSSQGPRPQISPESLSPRRLPEPPIRRIPDGLPQGLHAPAQWPQEDPQTPRIATGIQDRSQRLKALGNSIVPQVAFRFFQAIVNQSL